jgi:hypothetical protein
MKESTGKVTRLCEAWWERLADAGKNEQHRYARELLQLLGWEHALPFSPREGGGPAALPFVLRAGGQTAIAAYFLMPGVLLPPSRVVESGLDFCPATRYLADQARELSVTCMLATDLQRAYLYDVRTDELVAHADGARAFNTLCVETLTRAQVERGALEEARREPRSVAARRLREWCERWILAAAREGNLPEETASLLVDRLIAVRYLFDRDILRRTKWRLQQRFSGLLAEAGNDAPGVGRRLVNLFHDMWFDWKVDLFAGCPDLDAALYSDRLSAGILREFALLSRAKFSIATVLESFNHGDPQDKLRVRMVPDVNEDRETYLARQSLETMDRACIEVDLTDEGYRAIFHWFDRMVALYERLEADFDAQAGQAVPRDGDLDLFSWSEMDAHRPGACGDKIGYACEHGLRVFYQGARQRRIARLLLTLHLISRYDRAHTPINTFPAVDRAVIARPPGLDTRRLMARPCANIDEEETYR